MWLNNHVSQPEKPAGNIRSWVMSLITWLWCCHWCLDRNHMRFINSIPAWTGISGSVSLVDRRNNKAHSSISPHDSTVSHVTSSRHQLGTRSQQMCSFITTAPVDCLSTAPFSGPHICSTRDTVNEPNVAVGLGFHGRNRHSIFVTPPPILRALFQTVL